MNKNLKIFFIVFLVSLPCWWVIDIFQKNLENYFYAQISQPFQEMTFVKIPEKPKLDIEVKSAISIRISQTGRDYNPPTTLPFSRAPKILFAKNPEEILPIASLTKLMTAVIVLDSNPPTTLPAEGGAPNPYDFSRMITISKRAALQDDVPIYGNLIAGQKETVENLLNLMLIYSSNDAAFALPEVIGTENFVEKMNQKAEELGLGNTHFVNPTGLDPENLHFSSETLDDFNYSSAKDLATLVQYLLENHPLIFEISLKEGHYLIENGISDLILPGSFKILGGKTGYTDEAGGCMILIFESERYPPATLPAESGAPGTIFINIILGASTAEARILEMQKLIDWLIL